MDDFEIELYPEEDTHNSSGQLPTNFIMVGNVDVDDVKIYIKKNVYDMLERYACSDTSIELGTILLGDYVELYGNIHIIISDFIYAKYTDASAATLTFTHKTWEYVHQVREQEFPDKKIIGWQHTHPGYGIFLSGYDMFIQKNFFNMPFQTAYVIDPVADKRGFFQWKGNDVEKLQGYYVYDDSGKNISLQDRKKSESGKKIIVPLAVVLVLIVMIVFLAWKLKTVSDSGDGNQNLPKNIPQNWCDVSR